MKISLTAVLILLALAGAAHAFGLGLGNRFGWRPVANGVAAPPPTCTPGGPTGQMDFSVCSNIAITAAVL